jgi:hypothetical protein
MDINERMRIALEHTELVRPPRQHLATFGNTVMSYYVVTMLAEGVSVVRDGKVIAERPRIVTPSYLVNLEGFSNEARSYIASMARGHPDDPGIFYKYKNEARKMNIVSEPIRQVISNLDARLEEENNPLSAIIKGVEEFWDVSLIMFIYHLTSSSVSSNVAEFGSRGLLSMDTSGVPRDARNHIEELFEMGRRDISRAPALVSELNRWGLFNEYQDRFFALFRRG